MSMHAEESGTGQGLFGKMREDMQMHVSFDSHDGAS